MFILAYNAFHSSALASQPVTALGLALIMTLIFGHGRPLGYEAGSNSPSAAAVGPSISRFDTLKSSTVFYP